MTNQATRGELKAGALSVASEHVNIGGYEAVGLRSISFDLDYTDFATAGGASGTATLATLIPAGAHYVQTIINKATGFAGNVSAGLFIGDGSDNDRYSQGTINVFADAPTGLNAGTPSGNRYHSNPGTPTFIVTTSNNFGSVTAGNIQGRMIFHY